MTGRETQCIDITQGIADKSYGFGRFVSHTDPQ